MQSQDAEQGHSFQDYSLTTVTGDGGMTSGRIPPSHSSVWVSHIQKGTSGIISAKTQEPFQLKTASRNGYYSAALPRGSVSFTRLRSGMWYLLWLCMNKRKDPFLWSAICVQVFTKRPTSICTVRHMWSRLHNRQNTPHPCTPQTPHSALFVRGLHLESLLLQAAHLCPSW